MEKKNLFAKKYSLLSDLVFEDNVKNNLVDNIDFARKYRNNINMIELYIEELKKHFDKETIYNEIKDTLFKLPDNLLVSYITAYMASDNAVKSQTGTIRFYNKVLEFGPDSIKYIERHGIITNRSYKDIPELAINNKFEHLINENHTFKGVNVSKYFYSFNIIAKQFVLNLIDNNSLELLDDLFEISTISFTTLINTLIKNNIGLNIINKDLVEKIGLKEITILIYLIFDCDYTTKIVNNINYLIAAEKYELLKFIINLNLVVRLDVLSTNELELPTQDVLKILSSKVKQLYKKESE